MRRHGITAVALSFSLLGSPATASPEPLPVVFADEAADQELGVWAIERFAAAGLDLPEVEIHFHPTASGCGGNAGSFNPSAGRVDVCQARPIVILHELAHVWAKARLSDSQREAYVAAGGFESWSDANTSWSARGSEDAANTIAWALLEQPIRSWIEGGPIDQRNASYLLLTGRDAPRLIQDQAEQG